MQKYFLLLITFFISLNSFSKDKEKKIKYDTLYINNTTHLLSLRTYTISKSYKFSVYDGLVDNTIKYSPNQKVKLGFGGNYKWIGLGFTLKSNWLNNDNNLKGNTKSTDLQVLIYTKSSVFDARLLSYEGYYIENPTLFNPNWTDTMPYPIRPDIKTVSLNFSWLYAFNNKQFSYKAAFTQSQIQLKSAGSFLMGMSAYSNMFEADSSIVPSMYSSLINPESNLKTAANIGGVASFGYAYTWVFKQHYFATVSGITGLGLQLVYKGYENNSNDKLKFLLASRTQIRLAFGYNKPRYYTGFGFITDESAINESNETNKTTIKFSSGSFKIFYGRRFDISKKKQVISDID